ncbi:hypothetical protein C8Q74DRAFT_309 [Fomes fomentarius]|nr:hypothetical protein C8Q74DRAFT_309 [Fomes fomentarius]
MSARSAQGCELIARTSPVHSRITALRSANIELSAITISASRTFCPTAIMTKMRSVMFCHLLDRRYPQRGYSPVTLRPSSSLGTLYVTREPIRLDKGSPPAEKSMDFVCGTTPSITPKNVASGRSCVHTQFGVPATDQAHRMTARSGLQTSDARSELGDDRMVRTRTHSPSFKHHTVRTENVGSVRTRI